MLHRTIMKCIAVVCTALLIAPVVGPGVAIACEGAWIETEGTGEEKATCTFRRVGDVCRITKVNTTNPARELEWTANEFVGERGRERYAFRMEGCRTGVGNLRRWRRGERCTDEIEAIRFERGTENRRCYTVKDERTGETMTPCPDNLIME